MGKREGWPEREGERGIARGGQSESQNSMAHCCQLSGLLLSRFLAVWFSWPDVYISHGSNFLVDTFLKVTRRSA